MSLGSVAFAPVEWSPHARVAAGPLPRVSIALCVYNGAQWLGAQLDSLLAQEDVDLDIVAVDDVSTDGSLALLEAYAQRDARIRVFANPANLGHLRSFEKCMALCEAPLIAPCDQDDVWHPRKLATLARALGDADLAYCDSAYIDDAGRPLGRSISQDLPTMHAGRDPMKFVFINTVSGHALVVRREVFQAAAPFPAELYHDWWLAMRAAAGNGVVYVDEPLVQFRRHVHACSPLGKSNEGCATDRDNEKNRARRKQRQRVSTSDRRWYEERLYLLDMFGATDWRGSDVARAWHACLSSAHAGDARGLFALVWRNRRSLPPFAGFAWLNALKFHRRALRRLKRAKQQAPLEARLFRV